MAHISFAADSERRSEGKLQDRLLAISFRGPGFNQIRLAAATVVLLHHSRSIEHPDIKIDPLFYYSGGYVHFGLLAVLIFFAISGFLVTPSLVRSGNVVEYLVHRALRIFPALFVIVAASMLVLGPLLTTLSERAYFSDPRLYLYAKNVLTSAYHNLPGVELIDGRPAVINGSLWTLRYEILSYAVLALTSALGFSASPTRFHYAVCDCLRHLPRTKSRTDYLFFFFWPLWYVYRLVCLFCCWSCIVHLSRSCPVFWGVGLGSIRSPDDGFAAGLGANFYATLSALHHDFLWALCFSWAGLIKA